MNFEALKQDIQAWGRALGFQKTGVSDLQLQQDKSHFKRWLADQFHADMHYLEKHGDKRFHPEALIPGTRSVICARMDYLPPELETLKTLKSPDKAYIARYALGRDYHKVMRKRLAHLAEKIQSEIGPIGYRVFADSAPVLEKALAQKAGLGWIGKNTLLMDNRAGSWFFLGEIYTDLPLPPDEPKRNHCGSCSACMDICPTQAIIAPYRLDASKCIAYLTIENKGPIPQEMRHQLGNRIFGCDDCQLVCPWNKFATPTQEQDFMPRQGFEDTRLITLFNWDEAAFLANTAGSPLRRAGYWGWLRNLAVALGNAPFDEEILAVLRNRLSEALPEWVKEHIQWAIDRQEGHFICVLKPLSCSP